MYVLFDVVFLLVWPNFYGVVPDTWYYALFYLFIPVLTLMFTVIICFGGMDRNFYKEVIPNKFMRHEDAATYEKNAVEHTMRHVARFQNLRNMSTMNVDKEELEKALADEEKVDILAVGSDERIFEPMDMNGINLLLFLLPLLHNSP